MPRFVLNRATGNFAREFKGLVQSVKSGGSFFDYAYTAPSERQWSRIIASDGHRLESCNQLRHCLPCRLLAIIRGRIARDLSQA